MLQRAVRVERPKQRPSVSGCLLLTILLFPRAAHAQSWSSPFGTGLTSNQNLFNGMIAKVSSLIAIVIGGYVFAHGEPGAKKTLAAVTAITGIAVMATNILIGCGVYSPLASSYRPGPITREGPYDGSNLS